MTMYSTCVLEVLCTGDVVTMYSNCVLEVPCTGGAVTMCFNCVLAVQRNLTFGCCFVAITISFSQFTVLYY